MARPLRIEYPGAIYHVLSRGDRREAIFRDDADRKLFLDLLAKTCRRTSWQIHAYCLMGNHFHLVVETPRSNLSAGMQWLLGSYTQQFNRRHRLWGHLFGGRYKALLVDGRGGGGYLRQVCDYVHLNPVRAAMVSGKEKVHRYRWSSCAHFLTTKRKRPVWLRTDRLMGEHGLVTESARSRREFSRRMESLRREADRPQQLQSIRRGWKLGGEDFLDWILEKMEVRTKEGHPGRERDETEQTRAMRVVREELKRFGWTKAELKRRRKGDEQKVALARRLREETAVSLRWIAENLPADSDSVNAETDSPKVGREKQRRLLGQVEKEPVPEKISDAPPPKVVNKALTGRIRSEWKGNGKERYVEIDISLKEVKKMIVVRTAAKAN